MKGRRGGLPGREEEEKGERVLAGKRREERERKEEEEREGGGLARSVDKADLIDDLIFPLNSTNSLM